MIFGEPRSAIPRFRLWRIAGSRMNGGFPTGRGGCGVVTEVILFAGLAARFSSPLLRGYACGGGVTSHENSALPVDRCGRCGEPVHRSWIEGAAKGISLNEAGGLQRGEIGHRFGTVGRDSTAVREEAGQADGTGVGDWEAGRVRKRLRSPGDQWCGAARAAESEAGAPGRFKPGAEDRETPRAGRRREAIAGRALTIP